MIDLDVYRTGVQAWLDANMDRRAPGSGTSGMEDPPPEVVARARVLQRRLFDGGYAGISYPAEYGGQGLSGSHERVFREESRHFVMPDFGGMGGVMFSAIGRSLLAHGTPAFCQRFIPKLLAGEETWCQFYSEPSAGSDLAGIRTTAVRDGDRWIVNGSKIWSTGAHHADYAMCLARTNWDAPKHRGLTWFAVSTSAPGVTVRPIRQINGATGFCEAFLDEVEVADDAVIGDVNQGWTVAQTMLVYERGAGGGSGGSAVEPTSVAPGLVALARRAGRDQDPMTRQAIARAHIADFAMFHLGRRIASELRRTSTPQPAIASYGKLAAGIYSPIRARLEVEIGGAEALTWAAGDQPTQHAITYLNGRMVSIAAGTNEMQRNGIGERVLGLPREPSFDSGKPFSQVVRDAQSWDGKVG